MSGISKEEIIVLLENRDYEVIAAMVQSKKSNLRYLNRLLYHPEQLIRWRAIEAMGVLADRLAAEDPEAVRVILRTLLWTINDESGGIGWSAPECIGEIIYRRPEMFGEFASIVLSHTDEEMLRRGVLWAAGRIAQARPELVREDMSHLLGFLDDSDPVVRGYALRLMHIMGQSLDAGEYGRLLADHGAVPVYEGGELGVTTVAGLASRLVKTS